MREIAQGRQDRLIPAQFVPFLKSNITSLPLVQSSVNTTAQGFGHAVLLWQLLSLRSIKGLSRCLLEHRWQSALVNDPQCQLRNPRRLGRSVDAKRSRGRYICPNAASQPKLRMVQGVEKLSAEFNITLLSKWKRTH